MAAFWLERRRRQEQADRDFAQARAGRLLLPLEETSSGVGLDADTDSAGSTLPADSPRFGGVSSNDTAVEETSGTGRLGPDGNLDVSSTAGRDVAA